MSFVDLEDARGSGRVGGRDRAGQPPLGPADRAPPREDGSLRSRAQVPGPSAHHSLLLRLQVFKPDVLFTTMPLIYLF